MKKGKETSGTKADRTMITRKRGRRRSEQKLLSLSQSKVSHWEEKLWEYDITMPTSRIRDEMTKEMLREGFTKSEINRIFKGIFFKEKVFNTKTQAVEFLRSLGKTYAVKYKIGIKPSAKMESLKKKIAMKEEKLKAYEEVHLSRKFETEFVVCASCRSRISRKYIKPPLCPVCGEDMRGEAVLKKAEALRQSVQALKVSYEREARRHNSKFTGGERWIIRTITPEISG